jgi:hypothetical protein
VAYALAGDDDHPSCRCHFLLWYVNFAAEIWSSGQRSCETSQENANEQAGSGREWADPDLALDLALMASGPICEATGRPI